LEPVVVWALVGAAEQVETGHALRQGKGWRRPAVRGTWRKECPGSEELVTTVGCGRLCGCLRKIAVDSFAHDRLLGTSGPPCMRA
jgi:hypothetical protein